MCRHNYSLSLSVDLSHAEKLQKILLEFEGAHQITKLWVNGQYVGEHATGGYTPFHFDISKWAYRDGRENTIVLSVDNRRNPDVAPDGDQYDYLKFSGLYRDVYLVIKNPVYIPFSWEKQFAGVFITTPSVSPNAATVRVRSTVHNTLLKEVNCRLLTRILDKEGFVVQKLVSTDVLKPGEERSFIQASGLTEEIHLWSLEDPYLYRVQSLVYVDGKLMDVLENPLGFRSIEFIQNRGFLLNGREVELVGVNRHQAYPYIGDAVPNALHRKDAMQFKAAGFNVVRLAHYPHDNAFVEACDELGILLMEEAPSWISMRRGKWFASLQQATRVMIRNHRNHPSILMWSGGINHRGPVPELHYICKEEDPSRPTASNGSPWTGPRHSGVCDLYTPMDYQLLPVTDRDLSFLCEHGSSADAYKNQVEVSRSRASNNRFGVALWTAHDYFSFKKDWGMVPRRPFSIFRVPNPVMYWYQSELTPSPMVYIADERASTDHIIHVFSNCDEVALYNNGQLVARQKPDRDPERIHCLHPSFQFQLTNKAGDLHAIGYQLGQPVVEYDLPKVGAAHHLKLEVETEEGELQADGSDIRLLRAYVLDEKGRHVIGDQSMITFSIDGPGEIVGDAKIGANPNQAYWGTATALIRSAEQAGQITVSANGEGLIGAEISFSSKEWNANQASRDISFAKDYPVYQLDLGMEGQLIEFGWEEWTEGKGEGSANVRLGGNIDVSITASKGALTWTDAFGLSGNLPYVAMDGVKGEAGSVLRFRLKGLPEGQFQMKTYHHLFEAFTRNKATPIQKPLDVYYQIRLTDKRGDHVAVPRIQPSDGRYMDNRYPASADYTIISDGKSEVVIEIEHPDQEVPVILNGFRLTQKTGPTP
ncbi:MAG: glycoside hydrolase family 2 TIM barrel-domain containing protein [Bacteroidota bacterium]